MIPARFELTAERSEIFARLTEDLAAFRIRDQIEIALAVADLHIFQPVELLGHGEKGLREEFELLDMQAQFARAGAEKIAFGADDIADVEQTEQLVIALADGVLAHVALQTRAVLLDVQEAGFAHAPNGLDAAGELYANFGNQFFRGLFAVLPRRTSGIVQREIETLAERAVAQGFDLMHAGGALFK